MNPKLKEVKNNLKKIEQYCKSKPFPSESDLNFFIKSNEFEQFRNFAENTLRATSEKEWLLYQNKINKSRV